MSVIGCTELRIGATEAGLLTLQLERGIQAPDQWLYIPYSVVRTTGNGSQKSYGYPSAEWSWRTIDQMSIGKLLDFFDADTDPSVSVYISTYTDVGWQREVSDFTAYMHRPVDGEGKTMVAGGKGQVFQDVTVRFTHLEAV
jgi:hypothetical protein